MRTVKLYAGLTEDFEIIKTDAPDNVIETQLRINNHLMDLNMSVENPYGYIEESGFEVECVGCHYDFDDGLPVIDAEFDYYDYNDFEKAS